MNRNINVELRQETAQKAIAVASAWAHRFGRSTEGDPTVG